MAKVAGSIPAISTTVGSPASDLRPGVVVRVLPRKGVTARCIVYASDLTEAVGVDRAQPQCR